MDENSKLPTQATTDTFLAAEPEDGIFWIRDPRTLPENRLVRVSEGGAPAFTAAKWAYAGQEGDAAFHPATVPQWMEYRDPESGAVIGRVAYAIWDESGKIDINMAGRDGLTAEGQVDPARVNGLAPHDLRLEQFSREPDQLLAYLNGADQQRNRSNFSMRNIARDETGDTGDDRRLFTTRELIEKELVRPEFRFDVGVASQDFELKPEWWGDGRRAKDANQYLRSFVNNGRLFRLINHPKAGARLVKDTLDERQLRATLRSIIPPSDIGVDDTDWMNLMRLLAVLRRAYPVAPAAGANMPLPANQFTNEDIYALAVNLIQGTSRPNDANVFIYDQNTYGSSPFNDPKNRVGTRVTPYIVATAICAQRIDSTRVAVTEYFKLWNPHPVDLSGERYFYGHWGGIEWIANSAPGTFGSLTTHTTRYSTAGPKAGHFKVLQFPAKTLNLPANAPLEIRMRPYLQHRDYFSTLIVGTTMRNDSSIYATSNGPIFTNGGNDSSYNPKYYLTAAELNLKDPLNPNRYASQWYSFEIDDPRMGGFTRYTPNYRTQATPMDYSWKAKPGQHSLYDSEGEDVWEASRTSSVYGPGYNIDFGENFPAEWTGTTGDKLARALSTFALPRRQYLHLGESAGAFAQRPWKTLSLDAVGAALAEELSMLGTTSLDTNLAVKEPGELPTAIFHPDLAKRVRDNLWLFDSVKGNTIDSEGRVRAIRGRISLNAVRPEALALPLAAPYRMVGTLANGSESGEDAFEAITPAEALAVAQDVAAIRPIRLLSDLGRLHSMAGIQAIRANHTGNLADAVLARLIQFGTVRQQTYTVEVISQTFDPANPGIITGEARRLVTAHLDTYSRHVTVQAVEAGASLPFALDAAALFWTTDQERPWVGQAEASASNGHAARSARVNPGESTWVETVVQGPGELRFRRQMTGSSPSQTGDTLKVLLDDETALEITGPTAWQEELLEIPRGVHRVRWTYTAAQSREDDEGAWLDGVSFTSLNSPPIAVDDIGIFTTGPISIPVLANDTDPDGDALTIDSAADGAHGTTHIQGRTIVYTPGTTFFGHDALDYQISDGHGGTATARVTIRTGVPITMVLMETKSALPGAGVPDGLPADASVASLGFPAINSDGEAGWKVIYRSGKSRAEAIVGRNGGQLFLHLGSPVVDEAGTALGGLTFKSFREPVFGTGDRFALLATVRGPGVKAANDEGLWTGTPGNLRRIAMEGGTAPGADGARFKKIESIAIADNGAVYFVATLQRSATVDKSNDRGLWVWSPGEAREGTTILALRERSALSCPGEAGSAPLVKFEALSIVRGSEGEGRASASYDRVAVLATLADGSQVIGTVSAAGEWQPAAATAIANTGALEGLDLVSFGMPDISTEEGALTSLVRLATLNDRGKVAFRSAILDTDAGIIAEQGDPAANADDASFAAFSTPVAEGTGADPRLAFFATLRKGPGVTTANDDGLWAYNGDAGLALVAREGQAAPDWGGARFQKFQSVTLLPGRGPLFVASVISAKGASQKGKRGVWAHDPEEQLRLILREGDTLSTATAMRTIRKFTLLSTVAGSGGQQRTLRGDQALIYRAEFTDGTQAILKVALP